MALTDLQRLGSVCLLNVNHGLGTTELQDLIDTEGCVDLAWAKALEIEATKVMFRFSAGDTSVDKSVYAKQLKEQAKQIRDDYLRFGGVSASTMVTWSGSATFGTAETEEWIDTEYTEPEWDQ